MARHHSKDERISEPPQAALPSLDRLLSRGAAAARISAHGRPVVVDAARAALGEVRLLFREDPEAGQRAASEDAIVARIDALIADRLAARLRPVFNLTGTILHTNLGRASLPEEAIEAMAAVARTSSNLEYDLEAGRRGDRDNHLEPLIRTLTGAEAATIVNNNAAAVLLVLNSLAEGREVPVSRGELIEIGGAFRIPDIMARAGARLAEVGTTNRTHLRDYAGAISPETALLMKVHTSNYEIRGFTAAAEERDLARLAHEHDLPFVVDLGSGTLVDLTDYGLPQEPTVRETLAAGADLVTFSGDKLLGGPQSGIVAGRRELVEALKANPMKRAMRVDKVTIAALEAVLRLYLDPERLVERLPTYRHLSRPRAEIEAAAGRLREPLAAALGAEFAVEVVLCLSQIGSGAVPVETIESAGFALTPQGGRRERNAALEGLAQGLRALPVPVIGRIADGHLVLDLRCLDDEEAFHAQLGALVPAADRTP